MRGLAGVGGHVAEIDGRSTGDLFRIESVWDSIVLPPFAREVCTARSRRCLGWDFGAAARSEARARGRGGRRGKGAQSTSRQVGRVRAFMVPSRRTSCAKTQEQGGEIGGLGNSVLWQVCQSTLQDAAGCLSRCRRI